MHQSHSQVMSRGRGYMHQSHSQVMSRGRGYMHQSHSHAGHIQVGGATYGLIPGPRVGGGATCHSQVMNRGRGYMYQFHSNNVFANDH